MDNMRSNTKDEFKEMKWLAPGRSMDSRESLELIRLSSNWTKLKIKLLNKLKPCKNLPLLQIAMRKTDKPRVLSGQESTPNLETGTK